MSGWISTDSTRQPSTSSRLTLDSLDSCKEETREMDIFSTLSSIPVKYDGIEKLTWLWSMSILLHIRKRYAYVSSLLAAEQRKSTSSKRWLTRRNTSSWRWNIFAGETDVNFDCAGGWAGLQWDPLPREANHPDGEAQEELQWESEWRMSIEIIAI